MQLEFINTLSQVEEQNYDPEKSQLSPKAIVHLVQKVLLTSKVKQKMKCVTLQYFVVTCYDLDLSE